MSDRWTSTAGTPADLERVANRPAVVGPCAGIEDRGVGDVVESVQPLDVLGLAVGLKERHGEAEFAAEAPDLLLELVERQVPVVLARPAAEHVEVDAVQHLDAVVGRVLTTVQ